MTVSPQVRDAPERIPAGFREDHFGMAAANELRNRPMKPLVAPILVTWVVLSVQALHAQTEYTADGSHSALEEEIRWLANRGRFDTAGENAARGTAYSDIAASLGPLAPHTSLTTAARHHSEDMAKNNLFQHDTIPGSAYYDSVIQPKPWDRMKAEGYAYNGAAENIAAGYSSAQAVHLGWWNSTGHRKNLCHADLREVGNGYYYWQSSTYRRYYTMNLGRLGTTHFFTGTVFHDANANGAYDQGEGVAGIRVMLLVDGVPHAYFDRSTDVGSFAIPLQSVPAGAIIDVRFANDTSSRHELAVPRDYQTLASLSLEAGEEHSVGTFVKAAGTSNVGFRNLTPPLPPDLAPVLALSRAAPGVLLRWPSQGGSYYLPQVTTDFLVWTDLTPDAQAGTGSEMAWTDSTTFNAPGLRCYRILVLAP